MLYRGPEIVSGAFDSVLDIIAPGTMEITSLRSVSSTPGAA